MDTKPKITRARFAEGMTLEEYREGIKESKALYEERYRDFRLDARNEARLSLIGRERALNVLVLVEDWCGDVMRYVPVLERMAEVAGTWDVRVFYRDQNPDLAGRWLKRGVHRAIPVVVFFNEEMCELAHFIEKPAGVYTADTQAREAFARRYSHLTDAHLHHSEMQPDTYNLYVEFMGEYRASSLARWQQMFVDEVLRMIDGVECEAA